MILLWGLAEEAPLAAVADALRVLGAPFFLLEQNLTEQTRLELTVGRSLKGTIHCGEVTLDLAAIQAAYLRPYPNRQIPTLAGSGPGSAAWQHADRLLEAFWAWAELTNARVINRPLAMASNNSKPFQAAIIRAAGFRPPPTLVTNHCPGLRRFQRKHGDVIYKSTSSQRSIVARVESRRTRRWRDLRWCPTQFQALVPGTDVRVHAVGDELFACAIESQAVDYRYAAGSRRIYPCTLPEGCAQRCREVMRLLGLFVGGIDLRQARREEWFCFEVNPAPGFTFFDAAGQQGIAAAIARALADA
jgi:glutathione synthase/RimK-type ligase-like ATP-grasp enzyme